MFRFREFISRRLSPEGNRPYSSVPLHEHSSGNSGGDLTSENTFLHVEQTGSTRRVILVLCMAFSAVGTALSTWVVAHGSGQNVHFGSQLLPTGKRPLSIAIHHVSRAQELTASLNSFSKHVR
jgi:hypothetical protein